MRISSAHRSALKFPEYDVDHGRRGHHRLRHSRIFQPNPDGSHIPNWVTYTYKVYRPLVAYFRKEAEEKFAILLMVTPIEEVKSLMWMWMVMTQGDSTDETLRAFQDEIAMQDLPIVQSQRPELLPLDLQAELHPAQRQDRHRIQKVAQRPRVDFRHQLTEKPPRGWHNFRPAHCVLSIKYRNIQTTRSFRFLGAGRRCCLLRRNA